MVSFAGEVGDLLGSSSWGVFLSYRRADAAPYARLLQFQLRERFPDARVFMDLDSIEPGLDFAEVVREAVDSCAVLVALIGRQWATLADEEGHRRLDNPDDYVRFEIQAALERGVRVIPVLVDGARPLRQQQLPAELHKLARLNALELSYGRYEYDAGRLLDLIQQVLAAASGTGTVHQPQKGPKDRARAARLIADAERIAQSITFDSTRAYALAEVAKAVAATDPDHTERIAQLITDAERIAHSITDEYLKHITLTGLAKAVATIDPDRAERIARSITDESWTAAALTEVAETVAATDPDRAEFIGQSITDEDFKADVLAAVAKAVAATDPDRAERTAQSITDKYGKVRALVAILEA
jgi:hypothetical protein